MYGPFLNLNFQLNQTKYLLLQSTNRFPKQGQPKQTKETQTLFSERQDKLQIRSFPG